MTAQQLAAGVEAALAIEDETLGGLSRFSLEQLVTAIWAAMTAAGEEPKQ